MAIRKHLSYADIAKLMEASDSEAEDVSEYENDASDRTESSDNEFDIDIQPMPNIQSIQSKNREMKLKLDLVPLLFD